MARNVLEGIVILMLLWPLAGCSDGGGGGADGEADGGVTADADRGDVPDAAPGPDARGDADAADADTADVDAADAEVSTGWSQLSPLGEGPRQETAVVALDGLIYVMGGFGDSLNMVDVVEIYDPAADQWEGASPLPVRMHHANAAVVDDEIFVVGFLGSNFDADGRIFVYDAAADDWGERDPMPNAERRGASAVGVIDGQIYVAGGIRGGAVADFSRYDPETEQWETLEDVPRAVDHAAFGVIDGKLVIAGGRDTDIGAHTDQVDIYDPQTEQWSQGAPMPTSRGGVASAVADGKLYVIGGEGNPEADSRVFDQVEAYDLAADAWETLEPMPNPRHGMGAAAVDGRVYVPGGAAVQAFGAVDTHSALDATN
jgi:N-acetylneuraminic acid mutarotase